MDIELEKLKKLEEALSDCVDILRDCQVDKTCDNCKHSDLPRGYEPCVYCRNKDDWEPKESPCPCEDGIDSKACVGCEHSEDGKPEYKPYESISEFVQDFQERFRIKYNPSWSMPMIWVRGKNTGNCYLVTGIFPEDGVRLSIGLYSLNELFNGYTYLDGSPVGMEVKDD